MPIIINVKVDLKSLLSIQRYSKENRAVLSEVAANRYVKFLKNRFLGMSNAAWVRLKNVTIQRKTRRQRAYGTKANPEAVLRETNTLITQLNKKNTKEGYIVGYVKDIIHPGTPDRKKRIRISRLVRIHSDGQNLPIRKIIVPPNEDTRKQMAEDIRSEYTAIIAKYRSRKK